MPVQLLRQDSCGPDWTLSKPWPVESWRRLYGGADDELQRISGRVDRHYVVGIGGHRTV